MGLLHLLVARLRRRNGLEMAEPSNDASGIKKLLAMDVFDQFEKTARSYGVLHINGMSHGECLYEFTYNPYDLNSMQVLVPDSPVGYLDYVKKQDTKSLTLVTQYGSKRDELVLDPKFVTGGFFNSVLKAPVRERHTSQQFEETGSVSRLFVSYSFPLTSVSDNRGGATMDSRYGYYRAWRDHDTPSVTFEEQTLIINTTLGPIEVADEFVFHEAKTSDLFSMIQLVRQSIAVFTIDCTPETREERLSAVQEKARALFLLISLVERNRFNWTKEIINERSDDGKWLSKTETWRWAPPPCNYHMNFNAAGKTRKTLPKLFDAFEKANKEQQKVIARTIQSFTIANCSPNLETRLVNWHSCLDFFRKEYADLVKRTFGRSKPGISRELVLICDEECIEIEDLVGREFVQNIRDRKKGARFKFTEMRNAYIHDGFDVFADIYGEGTSEAEEGIKQIRIARALAERLLANYIGLDYKQTSLGKPSLF